MSYSHLVNRAKKLRQAFIKKGEAHLGGSFSMIEILIALFEEIMVNEDKFILSKAHASFPLCLVLKENGLNPRMSTHLEIDPDNGIYCTTGSLGHGLPIATGMALARSIKDQAGTIYVMMSDGECQEGTTWESLLIGAKHKLHNLTVIIDYNKIQALTTLSNGLPLDDLALKFRAFNWDCDVIEDGHSFEEIIDVFQRTSNGSRPRSIIANTTKSKGIKFFENDPRWHARKIKGDELEIGKKELGI